VLQPWCTPFRLVRVAARLPAEYDALGFAFWRAAVETFIDVMSSNATLEIPPSRSLAIRTTNAELQTSVRATNDDLRNGRCVLIEIPVSAGITLHPGRP